MLAGGPARRGERPEVALARDRGWAYSQSGVLAGMQAVAAPVLDSAGRPDAAVALVFVGDLDLDHLGEQVRRAALTLSGLLR